MSVLLRLAIGVLIGGVVGFALEKLVARPIVQSMIAMPVGWLLASLVTVAIWLMKPSPEAFDVRAVSGGLAEGALTLLLVLGLAAALHAAPGWAGSAVHSALSSHRAVTIGILGAVCGAMSFTIMRGAG